MAGESPALNELARRMLAFDDDALAAIANRGLVRRARKDVEKSPPKCLETHAESLVLDVEGARVSLGAVPAAASCDCGAGSVCRHILASVIYLRDVVAPADSEAETAPAAASDAEVLALDDDALRSWSGLPLLRQGLESPREDAAFDVGTALAIHLPTQNVTVRWIPGQGLAGMLCTCHAAGPCRHKVAAVLACWQRAGRAIPVLPQKGLTPSAGAPRTRSEVLSSVRRVLVEMATLGTGRVSEAMRQRLKTLAVSTHGVDLPRLERSLNGLGEEIGLLVNRDARGDAAQVLEFAARVWALVVALENPTPSLVGVHRTRYDRVVGELELVGVGARQWRTRSGYQGLTVYFWESGSASWNTWTEARPENQPFDPAQRYVQPMPWAGMDDPREASRSTYRVAGIFRNAQGRLSSRPGVRAVRLDDSQWHAIPKVQRWADLAPRLDRLFGGGLAQPAEQDEVVLLAPDAVQAPKYDETRQVLVRSMTDSENLDLPLIVPHDPAIPHAVSNLESVAAEDIQAVLALLRIGGDGVYAEPVTLFTAAGAVHLTLDGARSPSRASATSVSDPTDDLDHDDESERGTGAVPLSRVGLLLQQALGRLEDIAEAGMRVSRDIGPLAACSKAFETLGLESCRCATAAAADAIMRVQRGGGELQNTAEQLYTACYVLRLALQQEALSMWSRRLEPNSRP